MAEPGKAIAGRKKGTIDKNSPRALQWEFNRRLAADFRKHGIGAIERVREENPAEYLKVIARVLPKDVEFTHRIEFADVLLEAHKKIEERKRVSFENVVEGEIITND